MNPKGAFTDAFAVGVMDPPSGGTSQKVAEPAADSCDRHLQLGPNNVDRKVSHSEILLLFI